MLTKQIEDAHLWKNVMINKNYYKQLEKNGYRFECLMYTALDILILIWYIRYFDVRYLIFFRLDFIKLMKRDISATCLIAFFLKVSNMQSQYFIIMTNITAEYISGG